MEIFCKKCGYGWDYNGKLMVACCPNCKSTVKIKRDEDGEKV